MGVGGGGVTEGYGGSGGPVTPGTITPGANGTVMTTVTGVAAWAVPGGASTPSGAAGGDLAGTYPNPTLKPGVSIPGYLPLAGGVLTGALTLISGAPEAPALKFGDVGAGLYRSAPNTLVISTNSVRSMSWLSDQSVQVHGQWLWTNNLEVGQVLQVFSQIKSFGGNDLTLDAYGGRVNLAIGGVVSAYLDYQGTTFAGNMSVRNTTPSAFKVTDNTNPSISPYYPRGFSVTAEAGFDAPIYLVNQTNYTGSDTFATITHSFNTALGTPTTPGNVTDGVMLGSIEAKGFRNTNFSGAAAIDFYVNGTPGTQIPGRVDFRVWSSTTGGIRVLEVNATGIAVRSLSPVGAGAATQSFIKASSVADFGIFYGTGAPGFAAAANSLYVRRDGSTTTTRLYVNTTGSTTWATVTTSA